MQKHEVEPVDETAFERKLKSLPADHPFVLRAREMEKIRARAEVEANPHGEHDEAIKNFDARFGNLQRFPHLMQRAKAGYMEISQKAAREKRLVNWDQELTELGDRLNREAGFLPHEERERRASLDERAAARGQIVERDPKDKLKK